MYDKDWSVPAAIVFALGVGYFVATFIAYKLTTKPQSDNNATP